MTEWWTYGLSDFLMFSPQVYYRLFELYNRALWPFQLLTFGLGFAILFLLLRQDSRGLRLAMGLLGALWVWLAWAFFWQRYASINWAVAYVAPFIAAQGLLLIWLAIIGVRPISQSGRRWTDWAGGGLFAVALIVYPLVAPMMGRPLASAEIFGIAPDPTAVATLALLALEEGRGRWLGMIVPALWCVISTATLWTMGSADWFLPLTGAVAAIGIAIMARQ